MLLPLFLLIAAADIDVVAAQAPPDTINLRDIGYYEGREDAPVTVVEFSDFGCPFCSMFARGTYPDLVEEFVATGRVRWVFVPFSSGRFRNGDDAERAARCAARQEGFTEMKARLYAGQREWAATRRPAPTFRQYAADAGLDVDAFARCFDRNEVRGQTEAAARAVNALRIRATPTFLIAGQRIEGALPLDRFRDVLDRFHASASEAE